MYTSKYRPITLENFVGNKDAVNNIRKWLDEWPKNSKCILIHGATGIGKSLLSELVFKKYNYNIIEVNTEDEKNKDEMKNYVKIIKMVNGQSNALIVNDIECMSDHGFLSTLVECIKITKIPIICTCMNKYEQHIKPILSHCTDIKMWNPYYNDVKPLLLRIIASEKIKIKDAEMKELYEQSNGDIRFMLNTLQVNLKDTSCMKNIENVNIFDTTGKLLDMDLSIEKKWDTYMLNTDLHTLMVQENYINNLLISNDEVVKLENMSYSADALSDADLFNNEIHEDGNWELFPYVVSSTINATIKCNKKAPIKFSQFLGKISIRNKNKRDKLDYNEVKFYNDKNNNINNNNNKKEKKQEIKKKTKINDKKCEINKNETNNSKLTKEELLKECDALGLKKCKSKNKNELIKLIEEKKKEKDNEISIKEEEEIFEIEPKRKIKEKKNTQKVKKTFIIEVVDEENII
jgi:replication factor C subunit 1